MSDFSPPGPRVPGWTLVATQSGPRGWHRIATVVGDYGSVRTACGLTGRPISESERAIICCSACQATTAKPS